VKASIAVNGQPIERPSMNSSVEVILDFEFVATMGGKELAGSVPVSCSSHIFRGGDRTRAEFDRQHLTVAARQKACQWLSFYFRSDAKNGDPKPASLSQDEYRSIRANDGSTFDVDVHPSRVAVFQTIPVH